jgi:Flp pilus assembly protein TadD
MFMRGQQQLELALDLDPENTAALRMLAIGYEKLGRYVEARRLLERLAQLDSTHRESRLRLAVMELRLGDEAAAERRLRAIVREGAEPWVASLAYQILARILGDAGRFEEVAQLLRQARRELPRDQRIRILAAYADDRLGDAVGARRQLDSLPVDSDARTPRYRYAEPADERLELLRSRLAEAVNVRLPALSGALEQVLEEEAPR